MYTRSATLLLFIALFTFQTQAQKFERADPAEKGFSQEKLDSLGMFLEEAGSSALMILVDGKIVYSWGDIEQKVLVHSIRKSLLNSLYGIYVGNGTIDTTLTLKELGIDDIPPSLSENEKTATIADLLKSRSGVYHPSAATSEGMLIGMPDRGTYKPNEFFFYNNWDFNTLGYILEQQTGKKIYDLWYEHIAQPLGMDFGNKFISVKDPTDDWKIPDVDGFYQYETDKSNFPAYHFRLSSTDMALYGQLFLNRGKWGDQQIISESWIDVSTKVHSIKNEKYGLAYGMLWNVLIPDEDTQNESFYHTGTGVHMLGVYPDSGVVLVHRVNTEEEFRFHDGNFYQMIRMVWGARLSE
ncbi:MAG: serine hydrolase [Bacteroidota bacterium]